MIGCPLLSLEYRYKTVIGSKEVGMGWQSILVWHKCNWLLVKVHLNMHDLVLIEVVLCEVESVVGGSSFAC